MNVVVIGGGIAGLAFALGLKQRGIPCTVFEAAPEIKPLGVGITLLPHAMRELSALGLEDRLRKAKAARITPADIRMCTRIRHPEMKWQGPESYKFKSGSVRSCGAAWQAAAGWQPAHSLRDCQSRAGYPTRPTKHRCV